MMEVKLIAMTPDAQRVVAAAARTCYSSKPVGSVMDGMDSAQVEDYIRMLAELGHESPLEHASFTFAVSGVSRSLLAQLTRHRMASYSVRSQRYVSEKGFGAVVPPAVAAVPEAKAAFDEIIDLERKAYVKISEILYKKYMKDKAPDDAEAKKAARSRSREDARFVLPNACETQLMFTMNARALYNFFSQRCCGRAQWEIRELAERMLKLVKAECPAIFDRAGPPCVFGPCPEGKMCCGRMGEMREKYAGGKANG